MADRITPSVAVESPGMVTLSELAMSLVDFPPDAAVANRDKDPPLALHLPVRAAGQTIAAQHLWPPLEPVRVVGVWLLLLQVTSMSCRRPTAAASGSACLRPRSIHSDLMGKKNG